MSNQTISEAVKDLATAMAHDFYDRYAGKASLSQTRQAFIETVIRARAIDAAAEPIDTRIREIFKSNPTLKNFAEELARYRDAAARENPCSKIFDHKWLDPKCVEKGCQSLAARVELTDKWTVGPAFANGGRIVGTEIWAGATLIARVFDRDKREFEKICAAHNASLPATPTPQGQTSEETGPPNCVLCGKPPHTDSCGHSYLPPYAERETKSGASLGAATDKEETALCPYHGNYYSPAQCGVCSKIVAPATTLGAWEERDGQTGDIFATLRSANLARQAAWCPGQTPPDLSFRGNELAGETGEVCNVIKKLERVRLGWRGSLDTVEHLAEELGDVVICADLIGIAAGIDLQSAIVAKFNATSEKVGLPHRLVSSPSPQPQVAEGKEERQQSGWIKTADRPPTKEDGEWILVFNASILEADIKKADRHHNAVRWPFWMPIPTVEGQQKDLGER